jgi:hypothetical protein
MSKHRPSRILLQTTISTVEDDWNIARFSLLTDFLRVQRDPSGLPLFEVTARDRDPAGAPDRVLSTLDESDFDQLWLFAVDTGDGLTADDCAAIGRFRRRGGGLFVTRDHMDLGCSICSLGDIGAAHYFHTKNPDPDPSRHRIDDPFSSRILWPNYHSGANGDYQTIEAVEPIHPALADPTSPSGSIRRLPAHPHEGAVGAPPNDPSARVIAFGHSRVTGARFNIAVAFSASERGGPGLAQSTFHHFADYNWDTRLGCPSFVDEPPGDAMASNPAALADTQRYVRNAALWLSMRGNG